jgi:hypothetical protein
LGEYHPAAANSYAESFAVSRRGAISISKWIAGSVAIAVTNICLSHSKSGWQLGGKSDACANIFASCVSKALRNRFPTDLDRKASSFLAGRI